MRAWVLTWIQVSFSEHKNLEKLFLPTRPVCEIFGTFFTQMENWIVIYVLYIKNYVFPLYWRLIFDEVLVTQDLNFPRKVSLQELKTESACYE